MTYSRSEETDDRPPGVGFGENALDVSVESGEEDRSERKTRRGQAKDVSRER
jgi:hypothetical protein